MAVTGTDELSRCTIQLCGQNMAEERTKTGTVLLVVNSKKISLELFPADAWPEQNTGENLYRVRVDGRWHCPLGKYSFLTLAAVGGLVASLLGGVVPVEPEVLPEWVCKGAEVRALYGECFEGVPMYSLRGYLLGKATLGADGRWYAPCHLYGKGRQFLPVADMQPVRR